MKSEHMKWRFTFPAVLIVGLLLFFIIGGSFFSNYLRRRIYDERINQLNEITSQVYTNLNNSLNVHWLYLTFAINMLEGYDPKTLQEITEYIGELERVLETESRGSRFVLLDSQGNCYDTSGYRGLWPDVHILSSGDDRYSFISDSYIYEGNYWKFVQKLSTPIYVDDADVSFAYIALLKNMEMLTSYYDSGAYDGHNETYILKSDGTRMNEGLFHGRMIQSYNVLNTLEKMEGQKYTDIRAALAKTHMLSSNFTYKGEEYYYCIASLPDHDAYLMFLIPARFVAVETVGMVSTVVRTLLVLAAFLTFLMVLTVAAVIRHQNSARMVRQEQANLKRQEDLNVQLAEANRAKSFFFSDMSHEIRTPINAILGMNEMILRECTDETVLYYAANIQSSGRTLLFLINDILDVSKIEFGKMEIVPVEYKTADILMDLWNIIYLRAQEKGLSLDFILDETLPQTLFGDDMRIKQVITNLLTNAVKYTSKGGIELYANYEKADDDTINLIVAVKDTGMGIRQEDMGKLFESFQRIEEEKNRKVEGTGLGMTIVVSLLRLMGGSIKVDSEYQKGSTFTVTIPQKVISYEATGSFSSIFSNQKMKLNQTQESFVAPEANVLVVDDNEMNLSVFKSLLKRTKVNVVAVNSGKKSLELVATQQFHIIFMDHMMPEMDGIETLHEIQKLSDSPNVNTPVICLTANALSGARESYLKEGFTDFMTKPIDADLLERMIVSYLPEDLVEMAKQTEEAAETEVFDEDLVAYMRDSYNVEINNGLSLVKGDLETYLNIVDLFLRDRGKQDVMHELVQEQNMEEYAILVHGLKGNARSLGADKLAEIAYDHEMKSKAGESEYVASHWDELIAAWDSTLNGFQEFYGIYHTEEKYGRVISDDGKVLELSQDDLAKVAALLDDFETEQAIEVLKEWIGSPLEQTMYERIKNVLIALEDEFDEDKAIELLKESEGDGYVS